MVSSKLKETRLWIGVAIMAASTSLSAMPEAWEPLGNTQLEKKENITFSGLEISPQLAWVRYQESADTRWLGLALSALNDKQLDVEETLLKARVLQALHQFDQSLFLLSELKEKHPNHAGIRLLRSSVRLTQGQTEEALKDCQYNQADDNSVFLYKACQALILARMGKANQAYQDLIGHSKQVSALPASEQVWVYGILAELADQQGLPEAKKWYAYSMALAPDEIFTRLTFSDYLYRQQDWTTLKRITQSSGKHPRFAILNAVASRQLGEEINQLGHLHNRMLEIEQRQDPLDYSDLAWYWLSVKQAPKQAVKYAQLNWEIQQSPEDARLLLASAKASGNQVAINEIHDWCKKFGMSDRRMVSMFNQVKESS